MGQINPLPLPDISPFISPIPAAGLIEIPAGIECDAFANEHDRRRIFPFGAFIVFHHEGESRFFRAALIHAENTDYLISGKFFRSGRR